MTRFPPPPLFALTTAILLGGGTAPSWPCGGFFCAAVPMDQVAERILFAADGTTIEMQVQIQYAGAAEDFAWVLPVPALPELSVSNNEVFRQLQFATRPSFQLEFEGDSECGAPFRVLATAEDAEARGGEVEVASEGRVGPYETAVIRADDPAAVTDWLSANGYQIDDLGVDLLVPYVEQGFYFIALRLAPDREIGDLQPIGVSFESEQPAIPIRLTAVATQPNLGVLVWILGSDRAVPENYRHVRINEARIDWFNGGFNYPQVVSEAADEAGGHAFVTDYAGGSKVMDRLLYADGRFDLEKLRQLKDPADFIAELLAQRFARDGQMQALLRRHLPMPAAVVDEGVLTVVFRGDEEAYQRAVDDGRIEAIAETSFYSDIRAYAKYTGDLVFDAPGFASALEEVVVEPLRRTQELFGEFPFLTRLFTTLSAEEMTTDPVFTYNPDLPEVPRIRRALGRFECPDFDPENPRFEEIVLVVTLADGREVRSRPFAGAPGEPPILLDSQGQPAAAVIEQMSSLRPPVPIRVLTAVVAEASDGPLPSDPALLPNYPNPFNAGTVIPVQLAAVRDGSRVSLRIYSLSGQLVRTLLADRSGTGEFLEIHWDGREESGRKVASVVYVARLEADGLDVSRKLLLLR